MTGRGEEMARAGETAKPNLGRIEEVLNRVLERFPPVVAAYLFGSCLEHCRPGSDVDVGLVLTEGTPANRDTELLVARIALDIDRPDGREPDLVVLNPTFCDLRSFKRLLSSR